MIGCFENTLNFLQQQVADLSDEELILQLPGAPNHAFWTLGHIIYSCQAVASELGADPWLPADWESHFAYGSMPGPERYNDLSKSEILADLVEASKRLRATLMAMNLNKLAQPLPDAQTSQILPTIGHALMQVLVAHSAFHAGQLAAWRRAIGRKPVGVFI